MSIKHSKLSWIAVSDWEKAKSFFTEQLGMNISSSSEEFGWLELAGADGVPAIGLAHVASSDNPSPVHPGQNAIICLNVDNIVEAKANFEKKGVQFHGDIIEVPKEIKMALFTDPDGNKFQLVEVLN